MINMVKSIILFIGYFLVFSCSYGQCDAGPMQDADLVNDLFHYMKKGEFNKNVGGESIIKFEQFYKSILEGKVADAYLIREGIEGGSIERLIADIEMYLFLGQHEASRSYIEKLKSVYSGEIISYYEAIYYYDMGLYGISYDIYSKNRNLFADAEALDICSSYFLSINQPDLLIDNFNGKNILNKDLLSELKLIVDIYYRREINEVEKIYFTRLDRSEDRLAFRVLDYFLSNDEIDKAVTFYNKTKNEINNFYYHFNFYNRYLILNLRTYGDFIFEGKEYFALYNVYLFNNTVFSGKYESARKFLSNIGRSLNYNIDFLNCVYLLYDEVDNIKLEEVEGHISLFENLSSSRDFCYVVGAINTIGNYYSSFLSQKQ